MQWMGLMATRKVWSTLFSWVFRIFFCSLEPGMQTWPQQHQEKLLLYPFQHCSDMCNGLALFWSILFGLTTKFFTKITVFTYSWQFSSIFFLMQMHNETQMFLFTKWFFNKQSLHGFFQLSQHAVTGRRNYCNCTMGQESSFQLERRAGNPTYF